jgi:hypothetical protein
MLGWMLALLAIGLGTRAQAAPAAPADEPGWVGRGAYEEPGRVRRGAYEEPGRVGRGAYEEPGRVGRVVHVSGKAWFFDDEQQRWSEAQRNRAITEGDRFHTERQGRLQLAVGSTEFRLDGDSEVAFERLDDERVRLQVQRGSVAVRVRNREVVREIELRTRHGRFWPERVGHYRVDRDDARTTLTAWRGALAVDSGDQRLVLDAGRSVELLREGRESTVVSWGGVTQDSFSDWVARDEVRDDRADSERYVSPEMTGADELDRHGRWERHPDYGMVWIPFRVGFDWVPYRHGRWTWHVRWGWTWMDDAPWGFATSHYGRWAWWGNRWCWVPGSYVARPAFAPALVAWIGGPPGVSVRIGVGPSVSWVPLAPRDVYVPPFRHPPRYAERVNRPHRWPGAPSQVPAGPVVYGNQGVPQAVTVVPGRVLERREPVAPAVIREPWRAGDDGRRGHGHDGPPGWRDDHRPHAGHRGDDRDGRDGRDGRDDRRGRDDPRRLQGDPPVVHVPGGAVPVYPPRDDRPRSPGLRAADPGVVSMPAQTEIRQGPPARIGSGLPVGIGAAVPAAPVPAPVAAPVPAPVAAPAVVSRPAAPLVPLVPLVPMAPATPAVSPGPKMPVRPMEPPKVARPEPPKDSVREPSRDAPRLRAEPSRDGARERSERL